MLQYTSSDCIERDLHNEESKLVFWLREKRHRKLPACESWGELLSDKKLEDMLELSRSDVLQLGAANNDIEFWGFMKLDFLLVFKWTGVENDPGKKNSNSKSYFLITLLTLYISIMPQKAQKVHFRVCILWILEKYKNLLSLIIFTKWPFKIVNNFQNILYMYFKV